MVVGIFFSLLPLVVIAAVIVVIVSAARQGVKEADPGIGTLRRVFLYVLSLASLATMSVGATLLVRWVLERLFRAPAVLTSDTTLALGLALAIVGTPIWLGLRVLAQRATREHSVEGRTTARALYVYAVLATSAVTAALGAILFLQWLLGIGDFSGTPLAMAAVSGAVWAYHWRLTPPGEEETFVNATIRRLYVYVLSLFGLALFTVGMGSLLHVLLDSAYRAMFGAPALLFGEQRIWSDAARSSLSMSAVGAVLLWWHWSNLAARDAASAFRNVYLYLFGILGGATALTVSLSVLLYHVLQWSFGRPETRSVVEHFDLVPGLIAAGVVGGGTWGYHWAVSREEAGRAGGTQRGARRVYSYLVAAIGLVVLGVGLTMLFSVFLGIIAPDTGPNLRGSLWRNPLILAVTLLAVGAPLWSMFWRGAQKLVREDSAVERNALARRIFIYGTFGISVLLTLVNLSIVLFNVFDTVLGDRAVGALLWDSRWSLSILLTAGAVSSYYWLVLREDRQVAKEQQAIPGPAPAHPVHKQVTAVVGDAALPAIRQVESLLGYEVTVWRSLADGDMPVSLSPQDAAELETRITAAQSDRIVLLVEHGKIRVVPYVPTPAPAGS